MAEPAAITSTRRLNSSVVFLLIGVFCASSAAIAGITVLGKEVYDLTRHELDLGLLGLAEFAPAALLVLLTGSIADRFDRRRVAAVAAIGQAFAAGLLALYTYSGLGSVLPIFAIVFLFGIARAFFAPSSRSLPADIIAHEHLPWLVARYSGTWQSAIIVGPVLGGFLYARNPVYPYVAMIVLLVIAAAAMLSVGVRAESGTGADEPAEVSANVEELIPDGETRLHAAMEGFRFVRNQPILLGAISLDLFAVLFGGAVALLPAIAEDRLGVGVVGLGWLRAAGGMGAALVTLSLAIRPVSRRVGRTLLVVVAIFGAFTILLGLTHTFLIAFACMFVLSGADAISVFIRATLVPLVAPPSKRGRVLALENVFIGASNELGAFESGLVGEYLGTAATVVLGGIATLLIAGGWFILFPALRDVDRFPDSSERQDKDSKETA